MFRFFLCFDTHQKKKIIRRHEDEEQLRTMRKSEVFAFVVKRGKGGVEGVVADSLFVDCSFGFVVDEKEQQLLRNW